MTERGVPKKVLQQTMTELRQAVPVYINGPSSGLCETTYLFDNDPEEMGVYKLEVIRMESQVEERRALNLRAKELLAMSE